jgi:hypothetical protein
MVVFDPHTSLAFLDHHPGLGTIASALSAIVGAVGIVITIRSMSSPDSNNVSKRPNISKTKKRSKLVKHRR